MAVTWTADRDLYWDSNKTKILEVTDDDSDKAFVLCKEGQEVSPDIVIEAGGIEALQKKVEKKPKKKTTTKEVKKEQVEDKAVKPKKATTKKNNPHNNPHIK